MVAGDGDRGGGGGDGGGGEGGGGRLRPDLRWHRRRHPQAKADDRRNGGPGVQ